MSRLFAAFPAFVCLLAGPVAAQFITVRVHAKLIVDPVDGTLPSNLTQAEWETRLRGAFKQANEQSGSLWWRGYRLELVGTQLIGQQFASGATVTGPSRYHIADPEPQPGVIRDAFNHKTEYGWSETALNVFFSENAGYSYCGCPAPDHPNPVEAADSPLASITSRIYPDDSLGTGYHLLHEMGHFFHLYHTFDEDEVADTWPDPMTYGRDAIAWELFRHGIADCTADERFSVDHDAGRNNIALFLYGSTYSNLPADKQAIVDGTFTDSWLHTFLADKYYGKPYSSLSTEEKNKVDADTANPPWVQRSLDTVAMKLYGHYASNNSYGVLTAAERTQAIAVYLQRNRDGIAYRHGEGAYATLDAGKQGMVDDVFFNLMSYSEKSQVLTRLTEGQCDRWADAANTFRHQAVDGYSRFVSLTGSDIFVIIPNDSLRPSAPARTVTHAVNQAGLIPGDAEMIVIRPGNYNEQGTFNKACTLRATRHGPVVIGTP